mmetsp:Transcript_116202/g.309124  ORF Transcript_116202/g.309124 Transcript_116202/m.309124 type:complete len:106 (-) Transcript_116202:241-558(-)
MHLSSAQLPARPFAGRAALALEAEEIGARSLARLLGEQRPHVSGHSFLNQAAVFPVQNLLQSAHCSHLPVTSLKVAMQVLSAQLFEDGVQVLHVLRQKSLAAPPL